MLIWLLAFAGLVDLEVFDFDSDGDSDSTAGSWLETLGLHGVPLTVALTIVDIYAFAFTYLARKYITPLFDGVLTATAIGFIIATAALLIALPLSAICIKPLRNVFHTHEGVAKKDLDGTICTVTTLNVTETFGQACTDDGMVFTVRAVTPNDIAKGSRVVLLEYSPEGDSYSVVTQTELMAMSSSTTTN